MLGQVMSARTGKMYLDLVLKNEHATNVRPGPPIPSMTASSP